MTIKRITAFLALAALAVWAGLGIRWEEPVHAQQGPANLSRVAGVYDSTQYSHWGAAIAAGNTATGSQTITVCPAYQTLPDGRIFNPFYQASGNGYAPIIVDPQNSSVTDSVTPTAVSQVGPVSGYGPQPCEAVTASFTYTHGASLAPNQVISGDQGILEAVNDASANGGGMVYWTADTGSLTLSTGGATTTSPAIVPTAFYTGGGACKILATITTATSFSLGLSGTTTAFVNTSTNITAGNTIQNTFLGTMGTKVGTTVVPGAALTPLIVTASTTPAAGAVHCKAWGWMAAQPGS